MGERGSAQGRGAAKRPRERGDGERSPETTAGERREERDRDNKRSAKRGGVGKQRYIERWRDRKSVV